MEFARGERADAQHWAGELVGRFLRDRPGLAAIALTADGAILTALGNNYGYARVFARQVEALGRPGDMLFALSTSGRSANILAAAQGAAQRSSTSRKVRTPSLCPRFAANAVRRHLHAPACTLANVLRTPWCCPRRSRTGR
jgi:hypothetical protein